MHPKKYKLYFKRSLKNFVNMYQIQGREDVSNIRDKYIDKIKDIKNMYENLPESGLYSDNISLEKFIKYCKYMIKEIKDDPDIIDLEKRIRLEKNKLTKTEEYKKLIRKINDRGKYYQKIGYDFEKQVFSILLKKIAKNKKISENNTQLLKNPSLYIQHSKDIDSDTWTLIGEIDALVINDKKEIIAICEMKKSFDDIPDALFQIKRSYDIIKKRDTEDIKLVYDGKEIILDSSYSISNSMIDISFIFSTKPINILNIQSKIKFYLKNKLYIKKKINYKKLFDKIQKKKESRDKLTNEIVLRYDTDVLKTINIFKNSLNNIIII